MELLTESKKFQILYEYERVFLRIKGLDTLINIGDFYGNPQVAVISDNEKYCAIGGCGVIIYYLNEPFEQYRYNIKSAQWKEWGRGKPRDTIWVNNLKCISSKNIEIETEDMQKIILDIYE